MAWTTLTTTTFATTRSRSLVSSCRGSNASRHSIGVGGSGSLFCSSIRSNDVIAQRRGGGRIASLSYTRPLLQQRLYCSSSSLRQVAIPSSGSDFNNDIELKTKTSVARTMGDLLVGQYKNYNDYLPLAQDMMTYINNSPDPYYAVSNAIGHLENAGFIEWNEDDGNSQVVLVPGGKYYFTKNKSTLVAFAIGSKYNNKNSSSGGGGFKIIGTHTDSPNLKVKPRSKRTTLTPTSGGGGGVGLTSSSGGGMIQLAVECYGGGLWHTWFDRDLGLSGRVFIRQDNTDEKMIIRQKLVKISRPILRIPNLAIHLQTPKEREAFDINKEDHLVPIIASAVIKSLIGSAATSASSGVGSSNINDDEWKKHQEPLLLQLLATELNVDTSNIVDFELNLFDVQSASLGGVHSEFIHSSRLDNLASCFLAYRALIDHVVVAVDDDNDNSGGGGGRSSAVGLDNDTDISMIAMFDHEEVGSTSATGAGSPIIGEAVRRISQALLQSSSSSSTTTGGGNDGNIFNNGSSMYDKMIKRSFCLSVDMAHAVHPNYVSKHEKGHGPIMNGGMVIKRNSNQRYATNGVTGLLMRELARVAKLPPIQEFVVRNDCGCGSTIGPIISANTGIRTIDMGAPQLSMHSIRETMGVKDLTDGLVLFTAFFRNFTAIDESIES